MFHQFKRNEIVFCVRICHFEMKGNLVVGSLMNRRNPLITHAFIYVLCVCVCARMILKDYLTKKKRRDRKALNISREIGRKGVRRRDKIRQTGN